MKRRRLGCLAFGVCWAAFFVITNIGLALGHSADEEATNPLAVLFWVELGTLLIAAAAYVRAEMKSPDL